MTNKLPGWACSVLCAAGVVLVASMFVNWVDVGPKSATGLSLAWHESKWLFLVPIAGALLAITAGMRSEGARIAAIGAGAVITGYTLFHLTKSLAFEGGAQTWLMFGGAGALLVGATKNGRIWRLLGGAAVLTGFFAPWAKMSMWDFMRSGLFELAAKEAPYIYLLWLVPLSGLIGLASVVSSGPKGGKVSLLSGIGVFGAFGTVVGLLANEVLAWGAWAAFGASTVALVIGVLAPGAAAAAPAAAPKTAKA